MDEVLFRQNFEFSSAAGHFPATAARLSAVKVWDAIENRECAAIVHGFSRPRTTF